MKTYLILLITGSLLLSCKKTFRDASVPTGPPRRIQLIQLRLTERSGTRSDEIAHEPQVSWQACVPTLN